MKIHRSVAGAIALGLCVVASTALAVPVNIDNFEAGAFFNNGPSSNYQTGLSPNVLGDDRDSSLSIAGSSVGVDTFPFDGQLSFSNDVGVVSTLTLEYTASGVDLISGFNFGIQFDFFFADHPATLNLEVEDGSSGVDDVSLIKLAGGGPLLFPFSSFSGVDFTDVTRVKFTMTPNNNLGGDYALDLVGAVPEPGSATLLVLGLISAAGYGWARRKKK